MAKAPVQPQQGGAQTPAPQPGQSAPAPAQQAGGTIFRDWASI